MTRAGREGDSQPMPTPNDNRDVQSQVIEDIEARRELGIMRYGTALQPFNGRDMLKDAYEEALDLAIYLKGVLIERDAHAGTAIPGPPEGHQGQRHPERRQNGHGDT